MANQMPNIKFLSYGDALFYSIMVGSGETFIVAFALANGISEAMAGMISVVPIGLASLLQLATLKRSQLAQSPRRWVVGCAALQGLSLLGLGLLPTFGSFSVGLMFGLSTLYWLFGLSAGPAWNAWIDHLVAKDQQRRFFSHRTALMQGATLGSLLASGAVLYFFDTAAREATTVFLWLFASAAGARCVSAAFLYRHPNPADHIPAADSPAISLASLPLGKKPILFGFLMTFAMSFTVYIAAPFFSPYMLKELKLNYLEYGLLLGVVFVARMVHSFAQGSWMPGVASRHVFLLGMIMIVPLPVLWNFSNHYGYLMALQIWSGIAWGSYELGLVLFLLEQVDGTNRLALLTWFNASSACGMLAGTITGLGLMGTLNPSTGDYHAIFLISSVCRLLPLVFLAPFVKAIHYHAVQFSVVGLRAGGRSMVRPIFVPAASGATAPDGASGDAGDRQPPP